MSSALVFVVICAAWLGVGPFLGWFMSRRGYDGVSWLAVGSILGPAALSLALMERMSGGVDESELIVRGARGPGHMRVLVSLDYGEDVVAAARPVILKFNGHLEQVSLVRVLPKGGPVADRETAGTMLKRQARQLVDAGAEARLLFGLTNQSLAARARDENYQIVVTERRDEDLATLLKPSGIRYLGSLAESERMVTRECLAFPESHTHQRSRASLFA